MSETLQLSVSNHSILWFIRFQISVCCWQQNSISQMIRLFKSYDKHSHIQLMNIQIITESWLESTVKTQWNGFNFSFNNTWMCWKLLFNIAVFYAHYRCKALDLSIHLGFALWCLFMGFCKGIMNMDRKKKGKQKNTAVILGHVASHWLPPVVWGTFPSFYMYVFLTDGLLGFLSEKNNKQFWLSSTQTLWHCIVTIDFSIFPSFQHAGI